MNRKDDPRQEIPADPRMAPEAGFEPADEGAARRERMLRELAEIEARMARLIESHMWQRKRVNALGSKRVH